MRKLVCVLLAMPIMSFATSLDMSTLQCKGILLNSATTLADVQANCLIKAQTTSKGRYEVKFTNDATEDTVTCYFGSNTPTAILNSCK